MGERKCKICGETKKFGHFKDNKLKMGYHYFCDLCRILKKENRHKSKTRLVKQIFHNQIQHSNARGYGHPDYTMDEFTEWINNNTVFHDLHKRWVESKFNRLLIPTTDRINNDIGYKFRNLQVVTLHENLKNAGNHFKLGILKRNGVTKYRPVLKKNNGILIFKYHSIEEAARLNKTWPQNIRRCCIGARKSCVNYNWEYAD